MDELGLDPLQSHELDAVFDQNSGMTRACLKSTTMCVDAIHTCEIVAGTGAGDELDGTSGPNRLVSDAFARSILQGLDGDDILIGRAA